MRVVVIGGGAAGYFGAIRCAEAHRGARVTLLEATRRPLTKVRVSGGGRCNVTHNCFDPAELVRHYPRGARELRGPFARFQPQDTVRWFEARGVALKAEADGRMFPVTDDSATIAQCLERAAAQAGVDVRLGALVQKVARATAADGGAGFVISLRGGEVLHADRLLLATGSAAFGYDLARQLGHAVERLVPSLFTFNVDDARLHDLAGVAFEKVSLRLTVDAAAGARPGANRPLEYAGPLLITHWGLSGPAVLKLSAFGATLLFDQGYQAPLQIGFVAQTLDELLALFNAYKVEHPKRSVAKHPLLDLPRRFWQRLVSLQGLGETTTWAEITRKSMLGLAEELAQGRYRIVGKGVFKEEFVTAGGVRLKEVDFKTMQSRLVPGLYFAGELLDIDGITGGFNFQSAWTTSYIAGESMGAPATGL